MLYYVHYKINVVEEFQLREERGKEVPSYEVHSFWRWRNYHRAVSYHLQVHRLRYYVDEQ